MLRQNFEAKTNEVYLTGISTMNGKAIVFLSNGDIFTSEDRELQFVSKRVAIINGRRFTFAPQAPANQANSQLHRESSLNF